MVARAALLGDKTELALGADILAAASALRFWGLDMGLPHLETRPDETQVVEHVARAALGEFNYEWSIYPHAYVYIHWLWGEALLRLEHLLGLAPSADYLTMWRTEPARAYAMGRALTALAGVASVAVVLVATRRACGRTAAALAGLLVTCCLLHVRDSHALKPDILMGLGVTLAVVASVQVALTRKGRAGVVAGLWVGAAAAAKYNGLIAAAPVAAAAWWSSEQRGIRRILPLPLVLAGIATLVFFAATSPFVLINPAAVNVWHVTLHAVFPYLVPPPLVAGVEFDLSLLEGPGIPEWTLAFGAFGRVAYHTLFSLRYGLGWLPTLLAPVALVWGLRSDNWLLRLSAVFFAAWFAVICVTPITLSRYLTPAIPALAILEGALVAALLRRWVADPHHALAAVGAAALLAGPTLWSSIQFDRIAARTDTRVLANEWLADNTKPGSRIALHGTRFHGWGAPRIPARRRAARAGLEEINRRQADYLVTHDHTLFWSSVDDDLLKRSARHLRLIKDFDPRGAGKSEPVFEINDAFYIPVHGFSGISLPGPRVRIYRIR
jgi:hypothetical protein